MMATPILPAWTSLNDDAEPGHDDNTCLAMEMQMHSSRHSFTCFKRIRSGAAKLCRFGFPRSLEPVGRLDGRVSYLPCKPLGCEFINAHNTVLLAVLRCSVDVRIVQACNFVYYVVKYAVKPMDDHEKDSVALLHKFTRVLPREETDIFRTDVAQAIHRVCAMAYTALERQQMPASLAAYQLLFRTRWVSSHDFVQLIVPQLLAFLRGDPSQALAEHLEHDKADDPQTAANVLCKDGRNDTGGGGATVRSEDAHFREGVVRIVEDGATAGDQEDLRAHERQCGATGNYQTARYLLISQVMDYRFRAAELEALSPYEVCCMYKRERL